jgi:hypothetical protein
LGSEKKDRITPAVDLAGLARSAEREPLAPASDVRPVVSSSMVPRVVVTLDELRDLPIDARAAFLVSLADGHCSVETIADVAGMPKDEVAAIFATLVQLGAVELASG